MKKKILSVILALIFVVSLVPTMVFSANMQMSEEFKSYLNSKGNLEVKRYKPANQEEEMMLIDALGFIYSYDNDYNIRETDHLEFQYGTYNSTTDEVEVSFVDGETGQPKETHTVKLEFVCDEEMRKEIVQLISTLVDSDSMDPTMYEVTDMSIFNYWMTCTPENGRINSLIRFSEDFQKKIDYKNFGLDVRMGSDGPFNTAAAGNGEFSYNGTVYGSAQIGANMNHIIYVPEGSANLMAAAQARLDAYLGKGKVTLEEMAVTEAVLRKVFEWGTVDFATYEAYREAYPDPDDALLYVEYPRYSHIYNSFEEFKNNRTADWSGYIDAEGLTKNDNCYKAIINGVEHYLLIKTGTAAQIKNPTYKNVDVGTDVEVNTQETSIPLDTMLQVEKLTSGEDYEKVIKAIGTEDGETFDIKLHSNSLDKYITKLKNGKFQVKLPVPQKLEGKELVVYYVDANAKVTEHKVTVESGFATFETDHFSIYTLSVAKAVENPDGKPQEKPPVTSPQTSDNSNMVWWIALLFVSSLSTFVCIRKKVR